MGKKKIYSFLLTITVILVTIIFMTTKESKIEAISDASVLSLTQETDSFYVDATTPNNIHVITLNVSDVESGEVIKIDLGGLTSDQSPIVSGASVAYTGGGSSITSFTITFNETRNGIINIPIRVGANYTNKQKSLEDIQTATVNGMIPDIKTITAIDTKGSDVYEASLMVDAALNPYSVPTSVTLTTKGNDVAHNHLSGTYVQNQEYTFYGNFTSSFAEDGLSYVGFTNVAITPMEIKDIPGGFVLNSGTGWTQSGTTLIYDGTGDGFFTGKFTNEVGTYATTNATLQVTGYFGYDIHPVTIINSSQPINVVITTASVNPSLGVGRGSLYVNTFETEDLHGREVPDTPSVPFTSIINTGDLYASVSGDRNITKAHWELDLSVIKEVPLADLTIPTEATNCVVTFQDGTTQTYVAGEKVLFDINNPVTKIIMDFGSLPLNSSIPISLNFSEENCTLPANTIKNYIFKPTITFTYDDATTYTTNSAFYSYDLYTRDAFSSGLSMDSIAPVLQYGAGARTYHPRTTGGNWSAMIGSSQVYEPVIYTVLPLGVNYQGVTGGILGYTVSTYTISTGQTVVKIDYTGSKKIIGTTSADYPNIMYQPKAYGISMTSSFYYYVSAKNDPIMTLRANNPSAGATIPNTELANEITKGDDKAVFGGATNISISGASYLMGSSTISNNQDIAGQNAVNDLVYGVDHSLILDLLNSTVSDAGTLHTLTNIPNVDLTLNLKGPGILMDIVTGEEITDSSIGEILYSTSKQIISEGDSIDYIDYVSADEVTDWSKIQSFIVTIKSMKSNSEYIATFPITAPDAIHQLNKPVAIDTLVTSEGLNSIMTSTDEFIALVEIVHGTVHYDANTGIVSSLPADQTTEDFLDVDTKNHPVTLATKEPTKESDAYYTYTFKEWSTNVDGTGTVYDPGDTITNIAGGSTITLYAQWDRTAIPAVSATLQYDENTGEEESLPEDATTSFQPSQTGTISVSDVVPTKEADAYYTYTFKEWNTQANGNGTVYHPEDTVNNLTGGSTTTLYAQWNRTAIPAVSATLHYNANTGNTSSVPTDQTTSFQPSETGSLTVSDTIPSKNADAYYTYTFKEWNTQADGEGTVYEAGDEIDNLNGGDSVTLYAIWTSEEIEPVSVTVHYDANSGDTDSVPEDDVDYFQPSLIGTPIVSSTIPTKEADAYYTYTFKEWNTQADGKGTVYEAEDGIEGLTANSTITLYAIWNQTAIPAVNAILQYDANSGNTSSLPTDQTTSFQPSETGSITVSDVIPSKTADAYHTYTFKEWNTKTDGSGMVYAAGDTLSNLAGGSTTTLYAIWNETDIAAVSASVEYDANGGDTDSLPVDGTITFQPSQTGTIMLSDTIPTKELDAYHTYTFKEWNTKTDGSGMVYVAGDTLSNLIGGSTTTLYAIWNEIDIPPISVTVHYDANTGDTASVPVDDVDYFQPSLIGTPIVSSTIPTKEADAYYTYTFKEWNTQADGKGTVYEAEDGIEGLTAGSTITLYAQWDKALKTSKVITRYVDTEGNQIAPEVVMSDEIGEKYTTEELDKEMLTQGDIVYTLIETPINATGEYTPEEIVVTYIYEKSKGIQDIPSKPEEVSDTTKKTPETADGTNSSILMVMFIGSMMTLGELYYYRKNSHSKKSK